ncbi:MAG TPA: hypothetical protein VKG25_13695 [Bryobacteraceae bacterium]|nr:hypothetical protein [Bryobacteraceae bacterium]
MRSAVVALFGLATMLASTMFAPPVRAANFGASAHYSHLHPKHIALPCTDCHSFKAGVDDIHEMPGHATCTGCHNFAEDTMKRTEAFCGECHTSPRASEDNKALFTFPRPHASHDFGDEFSHVAHRNAGTSTRCQAPGPAAQSQCADCHAPVSAASMVSSAATPASRPEKQMEASHSFCFVCHCDSPRGYSAARKNLNPSRNDCGVCHVAHEAELARFTDVRNFRHAEHLFDTRPRLKSAGPVSKNADVLCIECHKTAAESRHLGDIREPAAATCLSCHTGKPGLPDVLPADLLRPLERP